MNRKLLYGVAIALFVAFLAPARALAQTDYRVKVPFDFLADGRPMKAGDYFIMQDDQDQLVLSIEPVNVHQSAVVLPVITRIATRSTADPEVTFDKVADKYYLSEVVLPGEDGFLVNATKETHTHRTLKGTARTKTVKK